MKDKIKQFFSILLCVTLIANIAPSLVFAEEDTSIDIFDNKVFLSTTEGTIKSYESGEVVEEYGTDYYPDSSCTNITLTGIDENASFEITMHTDGFKLEGEEVDGEFIATKACNLLTDAAWFSKKDLAEAEKENKDNPEELWIFYDEVRYPVIESQAGTYSEEDKEYHFTIQLKDGVAQKILYFYESDLAVIGQYDDYEENGFAGFTSFDVPKPLILNFQVSNSVETEGIDIYNNKVFFSTTEGTIKSYESGEVVEEYGTDYYPDSSCTNITLTGIDENASFEITMHTDGFKLEGEEVDGEFIATKACNLLTDAAWFSKKDLAEAEKENKDNPEELWIFYDEVRYPVIESQAGTYSEEDKEYHFTIQLKDGVAQKILYFYESDLAVIGQYDDYEENGFAGFTSFDVPKPLILNFQVESQDVDDPSDPEVGDFNVLTKLVPEVGQLENENALYGIVENQFEALKTQNATFLVVPKGVDTVNAILTFNESDYKVTVNGIEQDPIADNNLVVTLNAAPKPYTNKLSEISINEIKVSRGNKEKVYTVWVINQRFDDLPDSVVDHLCIASQYTNGSPMGLYGLNAVRSLIGSNYTAGGAYSGPVSLGGFGGSITYYYETAITDDPNNPYGIDFITFGNSVEGSNEFSEIGQVWVSENGDVWYPLAGGMHYEDYADWDFSMTYTKSNGYGTVGVDKNNKTFNMPDYQYPLPERYPWHVFNAGEDERITLKGIYFSPDEADNSFGSTRTRFAGFGYADMGQMGTVLPDDDTSNWSTEAGSWTLGSKLTEEGYEALARNIAGNPYLPTKTDSSGRIFSSVTDGMDLAWAVDDKGNPVSLENGVHYVKIVTASNIINDQIGEKSTEVNMVRVARANETPVGISTAPESISFDGNTIDLDTGTEISRNVYLFNDVKVSGPFIVDVDAENSNVYINNTAKSSVVYDKIPDHKIIRVIVQEGEKEPLIYVFNLVEGEEETNAVLTLDANGGKVNGNDTYAMTFDAGMAGYELPEPTNTDASVEFAGWYYGQRRYTEIPSDVRDITLTAKWESAESDDPSGNTDDTIRVSFRLIGSTIASEDVDLSKGEEGYYTAEYQNWIKTRTYTMHSDDSVYDLFVKATSDAGIESKGANKGYVSAIKAPDALGGYWLEEFTNGTYSGWMYTMDGKHTNAIKDQKLKDGADVIFHYVNDYRYEVEDWFDEPAYPSAATDGEFYNRWLEAADVRPGSQGGTTPVDPAAEQPVETPENPGGAADRFIDVEANDWFAGSVDYAVEKGFMTGTGADTFSPDKELTRGMLVSMLYSLEGVPAEDGKTAFGDVKTSDWFAKGVDWAVENGVAAGYGEDFGPDDDITREQMVVMLYGYAKLKGYTLAEGADLSAYKDVDEISAWALEAVRWAKGANLITGRSADKLAPKGTTTRAEAATILRNFLENVAK